MRSSLSLSALSLCTILASTGCMADVEEVGEVSQELQTVVGSYSVNDFDKQGYRGGGSIFADGTLGGGVTATNPDVVVKLTNGTWTELEPGLLEFCFDTEVKRSPGPVPPVFCVPLPYTDGPLVVDVDGDGNPDFLLRGEFD